MSRNGKIILGILMGMLVLCICVAGAGVAFTTFGLGQAARFVGENVTSKPEEIASIASRIAEYDVPEGFKDDYGMDIMGMRMVGYAGEDGHSHIIFVEFPEGTHMNAEEMQKQIQQASRNNQYTYFGDQMKVIDTIEVTIKGQPVQVTISEGESGSGYPFRQAYATFEGNSGQAMVVYTAPSSAWDQAAVEEFLSSIQ